MFDFRRLGQKVVQRQETCFIRASDPVEWFRNGHCCTLTTSRNWVLGQEIICAGSGADLGARVFMVVADDVSGIEAVQVLLVVNQACMYKTFYSA